MRRVWLMIFGCTVALGCEDTTGTAPVARNPSASQGTPTPPPPPPPPPGRKVPPKPAPAANSGASPLQPGDDVKKAEVGVGKRGHGYGGDMITEPVRSYFRVRERINFINMEHALKLYQAEHDRLPKSHEEFMTKIIGENSIALPDLPPGEEYIYDPKQGELMVRRPKGP